MQPKIGILICGISDQRQYVTNAYIQAIHRAGGLPLILPLVKSHTSIREFVSFCDGFLLCGGDDITPLLFGKEPLPGLGSTHLTLDLFQIRCTKEILASKKPLLAICRGMQVLNVACHGTILQDLSLSPEPVILHMQRSLSRRDVSHKVVFRPHTRLYRLFGSFCYTNSFHHQSVDEPGHGLIIAGTTGDGIVEAIEMPSHPFVVGVQWHPEHMISQPSNMKLLFHSFITHTLP